MRKKAVNKPVFGKIFLIRFLFWIVLLSFAAAYVYSQLYSIVSSSGIHNYTDGYRKHIEDVLDVVYLGVTEGFCLEPKCSKLEAVIF